MTPEDMEAEIESLKRNIEQLWAKMNDHGKRFDTLQTALWKRAWFRLNGWPGIRDLNASDAKWRPWHRWWRP